MSGNLLKIRRRISSIASTRKITHAMELVSSSKLIRRKKMFFAIDEYEKELLRIMAHCLISLDDNVKDELPLLKNNESNKTLYIVISSSLGLCGGYNSNLLKFAEENVNSNDKVIVIGQKAAKKFAPNADESYVDLGDTISFEKVKEFTNKIIEGYINKDYSKVVLIYTKYKNALTFIPSKVDLLPFSLENQTAVGYPPIFAPSAKDVLIKLLPKYLNLSIYKRLCESLLSEESARRNAMENATDNADSLNEKLTLEYNKARQNQITTELIEIVSGQE